MPRSSHELVVTDAGPLMAQGRQDLLKLLPALFWQVHVPQLVLRECLTRPELPDAQRIQAAVTEGWLCVREVLPLEMRGLDLGERCAIGMALGILGTLGVLVQAKRRGLLQAIRPLVQDMRDGGHFISQVAFEAVLQAAGEAI